MAAGICNIHPIIFFSLVQLELADHCIQGKTDDVDHAALEKGRDDARYPGKDRRYAALATSDLPLTESLKQTIERVLPYWYNNVLPAVQAGKRCIIVGHGNSIRVSQVCASIVSMLCFVCFPHAA